MAKPKARSLVLSLYPTERAALLRIARDKNFRTPMDSVRAGLHASTLLNPEERRDGVKTPRIKE